MASISLAHGGQRPVEIRPEGAHRLVHPGDRRLLVVLIFDPDHAAESVDDRLEGGAAVRNAEPQEPGVRLVAEPAPEFMQQARLADARLPHDEDDLSAALGGAVEGCLQGSELASAPAERCQPRVCRGLDPADPPLGQDTERTGRLGLALELELSQVLDFEQAGDEPVGRLRDQDSVGRRRLLQPGGQVRGVANRGVVHAQVVADATDDDRAAVNADSPLEVHAMARAYFVAHRLESLLDGERRQARAARRVLEGERRAEEGHHPIAQELVHRTLVAVDPLQDDLETTVHHCMHLLGPDALRERRGVD
jgi:hypothetical protein